MTHWGQPDPPGKTLLPVLMVLSGIDTTETMKVLMQRMMAMGASR
jgi:hypothetical protein